MAQKKVNYTKTGVGKLPNDKPVVYHIQSEGGKDNYVGSAASITLGGDVAVITDTSARSQDANIVASPDPTTRFLNVDLDVEGPEPLGPLTQ